MLASKMKQHQEIQEASYEKAKAFEYNKRRTLNTVLNRQRNNVQIDHIWHEEDIETDPIQLKHIVDKTMEHWT